MPKHIKQNQKEIKAFATDIKNEYTLFMAFSKKQTDIVISNTKITARETSDIRPMNLKMYVLKHVN